MFKVLVEKDGDKLLFIEGPAELVFKAVSFVLEAEKAPNEPRTALRFSPEEERLLIEGVTTNGLRGKDVLALLPTRLPSSIRSAIKRLSRDGFILSTVADAAVKDLC